jgi:integrase
MKIFIRGKKKGAPYYVRYTEPSARGRGRQVCVSTGTTDRQLAERIGRKIVSDAALRFYGVIDAEQERMKSSSDRSIDEHLVDFRARLETRYTGAKARVNVLGQINYIRGLAEHQGWTTIGQITAEGMNRYRIALADSGKSARTISAMIGACKHYTDWLRRNGRLRVDPLELIERPSPNSDRRLNRRMLLPAEWHWLVQATLASDERDGMTPTERCLAYRVAIQTGLRAGEMRSLRRGSFALDSRQPYISVAGGATKNRQIAYQYIDPDLARDLSALIAIKLPQAVVFALPVKRAAKMLQADLSAARAAWLHDSVSDPDERAKREQSDFLSVANHAGDVLDFHALRHTCGAWLALAGEQPKVIQSVMRHSTITLTLDTYGHLLAGAESQAVHRSAAMTAIPPQRPATGT